MYNADKPIKRSEEDLLGRSEFAQQLAKAIAALSTTDTFVVGLYGEWGSGKTSVLNLAEEFIREHSGECDYTEIALLRFNPWGYTDVSQLIQQFFSVLSAKVQSTASEDKKKTIGDALEKYSFVLNYLQYIPVVGPFLSGFPELAEKIGSQLKEGVLSKENNVQYQKKMVEDALASFHKKIVVFIDDIDRLPNDQIRMIFQLVNSVADFPNTTYVLSFDYGIVCRALATEQNCKGEDYLEKIVQIPFILPMLPAAKIESVLSPKLDELLVGTLDELFNNNYWYSVYQSCISPYISSVRDVNRFINTLEFKYPPLRNSINPIDFIGLTSIEIFAPALFNWIRINKLVLTDSSKHSSGYYVNEHKENKEKWQKSFQSMFGEDADKYLQSVQTLFPMFSNTLENYTLSSPAELRSNMQIGHIERFDAYFTLSVENKLVLFPSIMASLNQLNEQENVQYLREVIQSALSKEYFINVRDSINSIPNDRIPSLIKCYASIVGALPSEEAGLLSLSAETHCINIIKNLLLKVEDEQERLYLIKSILEQSDLSTILSLAQLINIFEIALGRIHGKERKEGQVVFSEESMMIIEVLFVERLRILSANDNILNYRNIFIGMFLWKVLDFSSYNAYMQTKFLDAKNILMYISRSARKWRSSDSIIGWSFNLNEDFDVLTVEKAMSTIKSSIDDGTIFSFFQEDQEKISAFELFIQQGKTSSTHDIDQKMARKNIKKWKSGVGE